MLALIVGATGETGKLVVSQLLENGHEVRVIVRSPSKFSDSVRQNQHLTIIQKSILDLSPEDFRQQVKGCDVVISCLGHVMDIRGLFGQPRKLCTQAVKKMCSAIIDANPKEPVKFILMNSVGVADPATDTNRVWYDQLVLFLLRHLLPPHRDNECAAEYLYENIGSQNKQVHWCIVRPDSLINADSSHYEICPAPVTGIFSGRPTSRANVAHFMVALCESGTLWKYWKFRRPVIMNSKVEGV